MNSNQTNLMLHLIIIRSFNKLDKISEIDIVMIKETDHVVIQLNLSFMINKANSSPLKKFRPWPIDPNFLFKYLG